MVSRRSFLTSTACILAAPMVNRGRFRLFAQSNEDYSARAIDLVRGSTVIDMLGLLTLSFRKVSAWWTKPDRFTQADLQRLKDSGTTIFHPAFGWVDGDIYSASLRDITGW